MIRKFFAPLFKIGKEQKNIMVLVLNPPGADCSETEIRKDFKDFSESACGKRILEIWKHDLIRLGLETPGVKSDMLQFHQGRMQMLLSIIRSCSADNDSDVINNVKPGETATEIFPDARPQSINFGDW